MTPEQFERIEALYDEARELDPADRSAFIASRCRDDDELRRELESLLDHGEQAGEFLELSAIEVLAGVIGPDDDAGESLIGRNIGNYEILSLIGRGGMGQVWRARDNRLGREVAIKTLPQQFGQDRDRMARFKREAQVLASLNHSGIASIYGFEEHDGIHCLVMEFVEGETLAARIRRTAIPVEESLRLMTQVAEALEAAHEKGVIHRDLKPANIVVTGDGKTKLLDFGLAKALEDPIPARSPADSLTSTGHPSGLSMDGAILGTAAYMSPEQARGTAVDKRTDIWAFGCVLYELLTRRRAFHGEMLSDVIASVLAREPDRLLLEPYDSGLRELVLRCLEKDPRQRFRDMGDVRIELTGLASRPGGVMAENSGRVLTGSRFAWAASAALLMAVLGGVAGSYLRPAGAPRTGRFVVSAFPSAGIRLSGLTNDLAVSPDGRTIAYGVEVDGHRGLYLRRVDQFEGVVLSPQAMDTPFFSPDSASIGFYSLADGTLKRMPVAGGPATTIAELPGAARGASWGPDDTIVFATVDTATGLLQVPARGGSPVVLTTPDPGDDHLWPEFLPGGDAVLFTIRSGLGAENSRIAVLDLDTGVHRVLVPGGTQARYAPTGHIVYGMADRLQAAPFDPATLRLLSDPVTVLEDVVPSDSGAAMFAFSDDGSLAYVSGTPLGNDRILAFVDRQGDIEPLDFPAMPYQSPRLSPDETRLAVQVTGDENRSSIWVFDLTGNSQGRQLTPDGNNIRPVWTPDGQRITFASDRDGTWGIYWQPADGRAPATRLTTAAEGNQHWPESWSPDGRTLSYVVMDGEERGIWLLRADGGGFRSEEFYHAEGFHQNGSLFSPDGDWLAYYSNESTSDNQIWVQTVPASGIRYRITFDGGVSPLWSPVGRELIYRRPGTAAIEGTRLVAVTIDDPDTFALGPERLLPISGFSVFGTYRDYDITADGQRFLMVYSEDYAASGGPPLRRVNFVFDWFDELKGRALR